MSNKPRTVSGDNSKGAFEKYGMPDSKGRFGIFGGRFVAETLMFALDQLQSAYTRLRDSPDFQKQVDDDLALYVGRPTPLYFAERLSAELGGARIFLKREDLSHTGAHKINNTVGQALMAKHMGKTRVIAETGAGQHGVATAAVAARLGLSCRVYMGQADVLRQSPNVYRMKLLGAEVVPVHSGSKTLKDALNEALRDWVSHIDDTHYIIGSVMGPHPYPTLVRDFQSVIGRETRQQIMALTGRLPNALVACVGGGSNALGLFYPFIEDPGVRLIGVEGGGEGIASGRHAAPLAEGRVGVLHGNRTYLLADSDGQISETCSVSAGLDYPGVGPEHSYLKETGRAEYAVATDDEALAAFHQLSHLEGIIPALESSHALAHLRVLAREYGPEDIIVVNLSGRGDKDILTVAKIDGVSLT